FCSDLSLLREPHFDENRFITRSRSQVVELAPCTNVLNSPRSLLYGLIEPTESGVLVPNDRIFHRDFARIFVPALSELGFHGNNLSTAPRKPDLRYSFSAASAISDSSSSF